MKEIKKIVVVGPESTGKSTLCEKLAAHYNTNWVREYAREYLLKNGTDYSFENLLDVAKGQLAGEEKGIAEATELMNSGKWEMPQIGNSPSPPAANMPLFIDTDMLVMKVWCEFVFDKIHPWILNHVVDRKYDLYLLCNVDAPWVKDELREYPDLVIREKLYHHYKDIMINQQVPWIDISGNYEERFQTAVTAVNKLL